MDDSAPAPMHVATREAPARDATPNMHALRHDGDFVICAQCRR